MDENIPGSLTRDNVVDQAASAATKAVDATKSATTTALDAVSGKVESIRSSLSPALNRAMSPLDSVLRFTREQPVTALACAAALGALVTAVVAPSRRSRR